MHILAAVGSPRAHSPVRVTVRVTVRVRVRLRARLHGECLEH